MWNHCEFAVLVGVLGALGPACTGRGPGAETRRPDVQQIEPGDAQNSDHTPDPIFRHDPARVAVGAVYDYVKSNIDGSHASRVSVRIAAADRLESLKWSDGDPRATLVVAELDWHTFSVRRFEAYHLPGDGQRIRRGLLTTAEGEPRVIAEFGPFRSEAQIEHMPWHSYDFDFASLSAVMPHLVAPERRFTIGIADAVVDNNEPSFVFKGTVEIEFVGREQRNGVACRKYRIDGPGLEHRGGALWSDAERGHIVDYEIALPDEDGYNSGKLRLERVHSMTDAEWAGLLSKRE